MLLKYCLWVVEEVGPNTVVGDLGPRTREGNWVKVQLSTLGECHNETHYFVQLIDTEKKNLRKKSLKNVKNKMLPSTSNVNYCKKEI